MPSWSRSPVRLSTLALALVFVSVLVGLLVADRTLRNSERDSAQADAVEVAALTESFLAVHAEALTAFRGLFVAAPQVDPEGFTALVEALGEHVVGFRRIWVADSSGRILHQAVFASDSADRWPGLDIDTLRRLGTAEAASRARASGRLQASRPEMLLIGERGFVLLQPIYVRGVLEGFAGGTVGVAALRSAILRVPPHGRTAVVLLAGIDTVLTIGAPAAPHLLAPVRADVRLPGQGQWRVVVLHMATSPTARIALWVVAVAALAALALAVRYERRQSRRIAERSRELEHLSTELLRANRAKSEFLANVSHELRTPLNAIVGFVDLLRDGVYGELTPRQVPPVQRIEMSANHLRHLVDQVLDLAKMAAGRLEVHTEILDLRPFVLNVASEVESLVSEKSLSLSITVGASLPRVRTDPIHLRQILVNLLGNAIKFTGTGTIAVRARLVSADDQGRARRWRTPTPDALRAQAPKADLPWIALQVADTGIGIGAQDRERIFDEFEQVNAGPRTDSSRRGTGLGLSISRRLARLIGGDISVESEPGRGSVFTVWLPVDPADLHSQDEREAEREGGHRVASGV